MKSCLWKLLRLRACSWYCGDGLGGPQLLQGGQDTVTTHRRDTLVSIPLCSVTGVVHARATCTGQLEGVGDLFTREESLKLALLDVVDIKHASSLAEWQESQDGGHPKREYENNIKQNGDEWVMDRGSPDI